MFAPSGFCKITEWLTEARYNVATHMRLSTVVQRFNWFMAIQLSNKLIRSDGESRSRLATEFCSFVCLQHVHFSTNNNVSASIVIIIVLVLINLESSFTCGRVTGN